MKYCENLIIIVMVYSPILVISMITWAISRMILYHMLEKKYADKISTFFPGLSHPNDFLRTYGLGKHFFKFERMIYKKDKLLIEEKRKTFFVAYISGILFYIGIILIFLITFICIITNLT